MKTSQQIQIQINGDFNGWRRGNVYRFKDGGRWRQVSDEFEHAYEESPKGTLLVDGRQCFLELKCMDSPVRVRRTGSGGR